MIRHYVIPLVVIVRAGVVWSGVGTLAVALPVGLLLPPPVASPGWNRGASCGCPASGSVLSALIAVRLRCGVLTLVVALGESPLHGLSSLRCLVNHDQMCRGESVSAQNTATDATSVADLSSASGNAFTAPWQQLFRPYVSLVVRDHPGRLGRAPLFPQKVQAPRQELA